MIFGKHKIKDIKSVNAILYPNKILIETKNKTKNDIWFTTDNVTILESAASDDLIVEKILKHLSYSKTDDLSTDKIKELRKSYLKITKFKSEKSAMENAKMVGIFLTSDKKLRFEPRENRFSDGSKRAFYGIPDCIIICDVKADDTKIIAENIRLALDNCKIT